MNTNQHQSNEIVRKYSNGEITIVWQPKLCIHVGHCFRGLPEVFDPGNRPWVNCVGAETERIVEQIKCCPSGALSFYWNDSRK